MLITERDANTLTGFKAVVGCRGGVGLKWNVYSAKS